MDIDDFKWLFRNFDDDTNISLKIGDSQYQIERADYDKYSDSLIIFAKPNKDDVQQEVDSV